jgi:peptidoglycan/xylan/chitin deacetylase (PgdA/CDA1 family)
MEKNPSFAAACVRDGHEIGAHGLRWLDISHLTVAEEKEYIKENLLSTSLLVPVIFRFSCYFYSLNCISS